jgi:hypothetical protein
MSLKASVGPLDRASSHRPSSSWRKGTISACQTPLGVGLGAQGAQVGGRDVVDVERQDLKRQRGIALRTAPAVSVASVNLRVAFGQVQATVGRQAFEQDFAKTLAAVATGRDVFHGPPRVLMYFIRPALPCGCARWAPARWAAPASAPGRRSCVPSLVSCVRMIRSVWVRLRRPPRRPRAAAPRRC